MTRIVLEGYLALIHFDLYLAKGNFAAICRKVREYPIRDRAHNAHALEQVCSAVDMACIWYWKEVLCLQRSAATTCLLRKYGIAAQMVIGAQQMPFRAHAWVEVDGCVVNDKEYVLEIYGVLEKC